jgi:hypothetical protein
MIMAATPNASYWQKTTRQLRTPQADCGAPGNAAAVGLSLLSPMILELFQTDARISLE